MKFLARDGILCIKLEATETVNNLRNQPYSSLLVEAPSMYCRFCFI